MEAPIEPNVESTIEIGENVESQELSTFGAVKAFFNNKIVIYTIRRILVMIPMFFGISILTFGMIRAAGDPRKTFIGTGVGREYAIQQITIQFGLNKPLYQQYLIWLQHFVTWTFGYTGLYRVQNPGGIVNQLIMQTAKMQYIAIFFAFLIAVPLGVIAAKNRGNTKDTSVSGLALIGLSMPIYVSGIALIIVFGVGGTLQNILQSFGMSQATARSYVMPNGGAATAFRTNVDLSKFFSDFNNQWPLLWANIADSAKYLVLPEIALTFASLSLTTRLLRSSMLEVLNQDYILSARANGLSERTITWKYALRNAILPVVTFVGLAIGSALAGAPITETVFSWPGLGRVYVQAVQSFDLSLTLGITMIITVMILLSNLITDLFYAVIDPRITI